MDIRQLTLDDAQITFDLRLRALKEHPEAYISSYEETKARGMGIIAMRLGDPDPANVTWGAFDGEDIVGMCGIYREAPKTRQHKANLVAVYVVPEARRRGIGRALCQEAIRYTQTLDGVEELVIGVTVGNDIARPLYLALGFEPYAVEPRAIRVDGVDHDVEMMVLRWAD